MSDSLNILLAIWGAMLSTILAIREIVKAVTDRPRIAVDANLQNTSCSEEQVTRGTKVFLGKDRGWTEILVRIRVRNRGDKSVQIVAVFIQIEQATHQIFPENIPCMLESRTQLETTIQKEWLDNAKVLAIGVLDATGKRHQISRSQVEGLLASCNKLPSNKKKYRNKETNAEVEAFQVADRATVNTTLD